MPPLSANYGGGIYIEGQGYDEKLTVTNSTFSGNRADSDDGGIYADITFGGTLLVTNSTFHQNSAWAGGGLSTSSGGFEERPTVEVTKSIFSGNSAAWPYFSDNCLGLITSEGYNIDDGSCGFTQANGSLPNTNPLLDPEGLADNGGPTETVALLPDSPAVDLVAQDACPPPQTDQRGVERPQGEACDSGAFELEQQAEPKTKAECKRGGYKQFGFKNQGRCIAFVNRAAHGQ